MKFKFEFTDASFKAAVEQVLGTHPDDLQRQLDIGIIEDDHALVTRYHQIIYNMNLAQHQIVYCAVDALQIDTDCLIVLSSLVPTNHRMELHVRLCKQIQELVDTVKTIQVMQ
jgi:hypothetical protein